jgi:hypothetical protein
MVRSEKDLSNARPVQSSDLDHCHHLHDVAYSGEDATHRHRSLEVSNGVRDPSSHRTPAQIRKMDGGYNHEPTHIAGRSERNQARRIMAKDLGKAAIAGKDIDHKVMVKDGGTNARKNLRVRTPHVNRGWEKTSSSK